METRRKDGGDAERKGKEASQAAEAAEAARAAREGLGRETESRPSLASRAKAALARKAHLWLVVPLDGGAESDVLYAAPTKKEAFQAVSLLLFRHLFPHYSMWLPLHGYEGDPRQYGADSEAFAEYASANHEEADAFVSSLAIQRVRYDMAGVASMFRMLCGIAPIGLRGESGEEVSYWLLRAEDALRGMEEKQKENGKEESLDKEAEAAHNEGETGADGDSKRKRGRPRGNGGARKSAPRPKKGDPNGN